MTASEFRPFSEEPSRFSMSPCFPVDNCRRWPASVASGCVCRAGGDGCLCVGCDLVEAAIFDDGLNTDASVVGYPFDHLDDWFFGLRRSTFVEDGPLCFWLRASVPAGRALVALGPQGAFVDGGLMAVAL